MIYEQAQKDIIKLIKQLTGKYSTYQIWQDFITLAACTISNSVDKQQSDEREAKYMQVADKYTKEELDKFAEMLALITIGFSGGQIGDFLGETYMQLELGNRDVGQFFTPYHVSKLMAELAAADMKDEITKVNEPSCGSGGLIIAYADVMKSQDVNYQENLRVICNDLDYDVVKMCYIQLSLLGIDAVVMQGDTITQKMNEVWYTPMHFINLVRDKKRQRADESAKRMLSIVNKFKTLETQENERKEELPIGQISMFDLFKEA